MAQSPQERLSQVLTEANALHVKGVLSSDETARVEELLVEAHGLKSQIEQRAKFAEFAEFGGASAGSLPIAAPGQVPGDVVTMWAPAGASQVGATKAGALTLEEEYGEGRFSAKMRGKIGTKAYRESFNSYLRSGIEAGSTALKTLNEGADTSGGFLVPSEILDRIIAREPTPTRIAGRVTQVTSGRDNLQVPRVNYTADDIYTTGMRVTWTGETPASSSAMRVTDPVFGKTTIPVYTAMMSIPVTNDMIEDSEFPLVSWLCGKFSETIDLLKDNIILNGTGLGQPAGILNNLGTTGQPQIVLSGSAGVLTPDSIVDVSYSLPEQYEDNAVFVMNKTNTLRTIAKFKSTTNEYLFSEGYADRGLQSSALGRGRTLAGYDVVLSGFMPNIGAANYPVLFGDPHGYYLVNRVGLSVQVLRELYAETNQILILGRIRIGGAVVEDWRLRALKSNNS